MIKRKDRKKEPEVKTEQEKTPDVFASETICPSCIKPVEGHKCRLCGATKSINPVSGNLIWMRNGRIVAAFRDERSAYIEMAVRNGISEDRWPTKFRSAKPASN